MSNSRHSANKTQSVLVLGHGVRQFDTTIYTEKCIHLILLLIKKHFVLVCIITVTIVIYLPEIINVNTNEPIFYPYSIKINRCQGSCNTINDLYTKICVPGNVKNKCQST